MTKAVEDARLNAETLATATGARLGAVRTLNGSTATPPMPVYGLKMAAMATDSSAGAESTYRAGDMKFSAMVNAEYDLNVP
jgi:uncharacterized protein YggE